MTLIYSTMAGINLPTALLNVFFFFFLHAGFRCTIFGRSHGLVRNMTIAQARLANLRRK